MAIGLEDENYINGEVWQLRNCIDRRFWSTSGLSQAIGYGVTDDYGVITQTYKRPLHADEGWPR